MRFFHFDHFLKNFSKTSNQNTPHFWLETALNEGCFDFRIKQI